MEGTGDCPSFEPARSWPRTIEKSRAVEGISDGSIFPFDDHAGRLRSNLTIVQGNGRFLWDQGLFVLIDRRRRLPQCAARPGVQKIFPRSKIRARRFRKVDPHVRRFPATDYFLKKFGYFGAFKIPSTSMCPTICQGERIVADGDALLKNAPQREDIILLDFHSVHGLLYLKRVIAIAGDIVSERDGKILVNGNPTTGPAFCGLAGNRKMNP